MWAALAVAAVIAVLIELSGCVFATPFRGPGYDAVSGATFSDANGSVVVAVTYASVGGPKRLDFARGSRSVVESLASQDGFIGYSIRGRLLTGEVWTMTVWRDESALDAFVASRVHQQAVADGQPAMQASRFHRYTLPRAEAPPSWADALARLEAEGWSPTTP